jgi:hypothetical protein
VSDTRQEFWLRRGRELNKLRKAELVALYRVLGGLGGTHPPEKWYKSEVISSIVDMEWGRLPEDQKKPDPPRMTPPCDVCGGGQEATAHRAGGDHHYRYTSNPDTPWVPESEAEAERIAQLQQDQEQEQPVDGPGCTPAVVTEQQPAEEQPSGAGATVDLSKPYCFRLDRTDQLPPVRLSSGRWDKAPAPLTTAHHAATYEAARVRVERAYRGPLRVWVWQERPDERYRDFPPKDAYRVDLGEPAHPGAALYKVHMVVKVDGRPNEWSFRTEEWATSHQQARWKAKMSLSKMCHDEGLTGQYEIITDGSCERVPGSEL